MNTIRNYLDNMFLGLPQTEEVTKAKMELLAMMEDKYNELKNSGKTENEAIGIVISEFGNLDELGDTLGIKHALEHKSDIPIITYEEAQNYIVAAKEVTPKISLGILFCIISPVILLLLLGLSELNMVSIKEESLIAVGLAALIALVAVGVSYIIRFSGKIEKYDNLKHDFFEIDYKTEQMVRGILAEDEPVYRSAVSTSVILYILSALPVIVIPLVFEAEGLSVLSVVMTLLIVAFSTYNLISKSAVNGTCNILLQQGDYSLKRKSNKISRIVSNVYWCIIVAIYLGYSFITYNWAMSWIIWPVAGLLFAAIMAIVDDR
ncbi:permease prefix domain 1-containing protein [Sedimentibacter sp.]|uniref:permease prefix domain 1-containing protein n=1 Tax=Sedimentibacter sp. TaxID=1960295 RepID=UPI002898F9CD|nr:permease prefix domain 1-containing protein [Sedimentibacter sp.]